MKLFPPENIYIHEVLKQNHCHYEICGKICRWHLTVFTFSEGKKLSACISIPVLNIHFPVRTLVKLCSLQKEHQTRSSVFKLLFRFSELQIPVCPKPLLNIWQVPNTVLPGQFLCEVSRRALRRKTQYKVTCKVLKQRELYGAVARTGMEKTSRESLSKEIVFQVSFARVKENLGYIPPILSPSQEKKLQLADSKPEFWRKLMLSSHLESVIQKPCVLFFFF